MVVRLLFVVEAFPGLLLLSPTVRAQRPRFWSSPATLNSRDGYRRWSYQSPLALRSTLDVNICKISSIILKRPYNETSISWEYAVTMGEGGTDDDEIL